MKIAVIAHLATYGNAPTLTRALCELGHDARLIISCRNLRDGGDYGFGAEIECWQMQDNEDLPKARQWAADADRIIIVTIPSLKPTRSIFANGKLPAGAMICSSSHLLKDVEINKWLIRDTGLKIFVQPHKHVYIRELEPNVYYPAIGLVDDNVAPNDKVAIGHTPGKPGREKWKGTAEVREAFEALGRTYGDPLSCTILPAMPHGEAIEARRQFHIFVDQVCPPYPVDGCPDYCGGLDKAGLEAMGAGCCVVTSGGPLTVGDEFPAPPVITTHAGGLLGVLEGLVDNPDMVKKLGAASRRWVRAVCEPKTVAGRILAAIE